MIATPHLRSIEKMVMFSPDIMGIIDGNGVIQFVNDACKNITGYNSSEMIGCTFLQFLHPDDVLRTSEFVEQAFGYGESIDFENRYIHKDGSTIHIQWYGAWSDDDNLIYFIGRDITRQKAIQEDLEESQKRYKAFFDHSPDIIFIENKEGLVTEVNAQFRKTFPDIENTLTGFQTSCFLPPDMAAINKKYHTKASQGKSIRFEIELEKDGEVKIYDTHKHPIIVGDEVAYIQTLAKDITLEVRFYSTIQKQAKKLNTIFESITDAFFTLDKEGRLTYINQEAEKLLYLDRKVHLGKNIWDIFPEEKGKEFHQNYYKAAETGESVHFEAYFAGGDMCIEVKAFPSEEGMSIYFNDVTEKAITNKELEKLSLVASRTTNGVIITDKERKIEWVNEGFSKLTGYSFEEVIGKIPSEILLTDFKSVQAFDTVKADMLRGEPVSFELLNTRKDGTPVWLSVQVTPIHSEQGELLKYVTIQTDITDRVTYQQELEKLSLVASKTTHGVIITDANGLTEWVNESFSKLTGYSLSDIVGKKPGLLLQGPETDKAVVQHVSEQLKKAQPFNVNLINYKKTGEKVWCAMDITPVLNSKGEVIKFIAIQKDITKRIKEQQELKKLSLVASKTNNGVIIADKAHKIEWVNEGFTRLTGYSVDEALSRVPSELLQSKLTDKEGFTTLEEKLNNGEQVSSKSLDQKKSGEEIWMATEATALFNEQGEPTGYIEVLTDITDLQNSKEELNKLAKDLYIQNKDLQQFTYIVSHNLRAPVANVMGLAKLLTKIDKGSDKYDKSLSYLSQNMQRLDTVLKDMNTILSIRDKKDSLEQEVVDVNSIFNQVLTSFQEPLQECNGAVINSIPEGFCLKTNKAYLYSIFFNLMSNAIKYRSEKCNLKVRLQCFGNSEEGVVLSFSDNGIGFSMDKVRHNIFKLYKRFHTDRNGRGIGLYLIKSHLETMGGHIEVNSQVGVGTKFLVYLPK